MGGETRSGHHKKVFKLFYLWANYDMLFVCDNKFYSTRNILHCIEIVMLSVQKYIFRENRILVLDIEHRDRHKTDYTLSSILNVKM